MDDNKFLRNQVKDAMKHNKLLEVAENKTKKQCESIRTFLKRNKNLVDKKKQGELKNSTSYQASIKSTAQ